ncbi:hypothetical protein NY2A_b649R [Paramecium bursaria Chlorella virus NY2A]|uniref:Uncharacterized protein b649R n=1 Tax=Paramecium bursaria Chlorella virus NY2A TaxID=46021 RepID=A7IXH4_PBCVN|nr:hypothetical protein NY2A_b649R [Paramecium bursaria Chlorella virus NY2A]ABT15048.1 hypothetical protein NY2A_b649R [Paramecium bursaria Chlorella virus NY2A]
MIHPTLKHNIIRCSILFGFECGTHQSRVHIDVIPRFNIGYVFHHTLVGFFVHVIHFLFLIEVVRKSQFYL